MIYKDCSENLDDSLVDTKKQNGMKKSNKKEKNKKIKGKKFI
jgi:hypothetical protein